MWCPWHSALGDEPGGRSEQFVLEKKEQSILLLYWGTETSLSLSFTNFNKLLVLNTEPHIVRACCESFLRGRILDLENIALPGLKNDSTTICCFKSVEPLLSHC